MQTICSICIKYAKNRPESPYMQNMLKNATYMLKICMKYAKYKWKNINNMQTCKNMQKRKTWHAKIGTKIAKICKKYAVYVGSELMVYILHVYAKHICWWVIIISPSTGFLQSSEFKLFPFHYSNF